MDSVTVVVVAVVISTVAVTAVNRVVVDTVINKVARETGSRRFDNIPVLAFPCMLLYVYCTVAFECSPQIVYGVADRGWSQGTAMLFQEWH